MATKKCLSPSYELENFANTYLGKVTTFQVDGLFRFGVLSNLLAWRWKTPPPPGANRVKSGSLVKKHRDSKNDWRGSCEIKMNNLEFSQLLINLKIVSEI